MDYKTYWEGWLGTETSTPTGNEVWLMDYGFYGESWDGRYLTNTWFGLRTKTAGLTHGL